MNVGILGTGHVADQYVAGIAQFGELRLVAVADSDAALSQQRAESWCVRGLTPEQLLADDAIELVVNLTPPRNHATTTRAALLAGKHVYSEKPLAANVKEGCELVELARRSGLFLGCAPDTFLGSAIVTAHKAVEAGAIGAPIAAHAFVGNPGPERWHPAPGSYYEQGAGPLFSLGPYYLTTLVQLLGPIEDATGFSARPHAARRMPSGAMIPVSTHTTYAGAVRFENGVIATLFASYDAHAARVPPIEIYGADATIGLPDPDFFDGPVLLSTSIGWRELPHRGRTGYGRGVGVAELARAIADRRVPRANGDLGLHVLDAICALAEGGRRLTTRPVLARPSATGLGHQEATVG